jgi:tripartite-type tricarboxylate transporter receptor subunit TctC
MPWQAKRVSRRLPKFQQLMRLDCLGFYSSIWFGLWAPARTPEEIITKLNAAVVEALADPTVRARIAALGQDIPPREQQTPEALGALQKAEIDKWWPIIKAANIKGE